jgi:hypothetical protein
MKIYCLFRCRPPTSKVICFTVNFIGMAGRVAYMYVSRSLSSLTEHFLFTFTYNDQRTIMVLRCQWLPSFIQARFQRCFVFLCNYSKVLLLSEPRLCLTNNCLAVEISNRRDQKLLKRHGLTCIPCNANFKVKRNLNFKQQQSYYNRFHKQNLTSLLWIDRKMVSPTFSHYILPTTTGWPESGSGVRSTAYSALTVVLSIF